MEFVLIHPFSRNRPDDNSESPVSFDECWEYSTSSPCTLARKTSKKIPGALKSPYAIRSQIISSGSKLGKTVSRKSFTFVCLHLSPAHFSVLSPDLHEITGDSIFVYKSLLDMAISENTLTDRFKQGLKHRFPSIVSSYPMRDRRGCKLHP